MLFLFIADDVPVRDKEDVMVYAVHIHDNFEFRFQLSCEQFTNLAVHDGWIQCHFCLFRLLLSE